MIQLEWVLIVSAILFSLGIYGVLARRNAVMILLAIVGLVFAIFIVTVAAGEVGLALAIILRLYRSRASVNVDEVNLMRW